MAKAATKSYTEQVHEAAHDDTRDKTATGGESLVMSDGANEAVKAYNPQAHAESSIGVLREEDVLPGGVKNTGSEDEAATQAVDADKARTRR